MDNTPRCLWETERLAVDRLRPEDADSLSPILADPQVMRWIQAPFTREETLAFIRDAGMREPPAVYAIREKKTGRLIGHLIWHRYDESGAMELGWIIGRPWQRRGYAQELTRKAMEQSGGDIILECDENQTITRHIAEKMGFRQQGMADGLMVFRRAGRTG